MRNLLLVIRREYLQRVRTRAFVISTIAIPIAMGGLTLLPQALGTMKMKSARHIVVAASSADWGEAVKRRLAGSEKRGTRFDVDVETGLGEADRKQLTERVSQGKLDGYLWMPAEAMAAREVTYSAREVSDFNDVSVIREAVSAARTEIRAKALGVSPEAAEDLVKNVKLTTARIERGKESKTRTSAGIAVALVLMMLLYMTVLLHGVSVSRSVIEEKTSRVLEVLLSSITPRDLMVGKILGVGAAGLTQVLIWVLGAAGMLLPSIAALSMLKEVPLSGLALAAFPLFYLLGYLLYACMYAAMGAMVSSEEEGHQLQMIGVLPLVAAVTLMMPVLRQPNSGLAVWLSMVPFFAPVLMYLRMVAQTPPFWQIGLCVALLGATIAVFMTLSSRIYRIGILMYGKRATLPEIMKWIKYAKG